MSYNHQHIDQKWQKYWDEHETFKTKLNSDQPKYYV